MSMPQIFELNWFQTVCVKIDYRLMTRILEPNQAWHFVGPDPAPNCLQCKKTEGSSRPSHFTELSQNNAI